MVLKDFIECMVWLSNAALVLKLEGITEVELLGDCLHVFVQ